jgi:hypothetical protein
MLILSSIIKSLTLRVLAGFFVATLSAAAAPVQATYYASPDGSGSRGTLTAPCSLDGVRDLVRKINQRMNGDIVVYLRGGTYRLTAPFTLEENATHHDSGTNGFNIIYQAYPGETPVLGGGLTITGWTLHDPAKNIYRAKVPAGVQSRQFYVNDRRAVRARGPLNPEGWTKTPTGFNVTDTTLQNWGNPADIEVVSRSSWKHLRCGIASVQGTEVTMKMPGWANASKTPHPGNPWNGGGTQQINKVTWIENAYELLDQPGEWYLDCKAGYLYYSPLPDDDLPLVGVLPVLETLLSVEGAGYEKRIHNLQFRGLTFKYATWLQPSGDEAYADNQAGVVWAGLPPVSRKTPGGVSFQYASDIRFERNVVGHMGGAALDFGHGPQKNAIVGNCIYDISGNGIFLGEVDDYKAATPQEWCDANTIQNNYITRVGAEYEDQVGIITGYTRNLLLDHNEIYDTPYSGISVGWGWSKLGYSHRNKITNNQVHKYMRILGDGGGIYTLGNHGTAEEKTEWSGNYVHHSGHAQGLYADEGSGFMEIKNNVIHNVGANWMNIWTPSIHDISVHDNFADKTNIKNNGTRCVVADNDMTLKPGNLTDAARAIVQNAGLQPEYAAIRAQIPLPPRQMVNDSDNAIVYQGVWTPSGGRKLGDYENDVHHTSTNGDTATFSFRGYGVEYITEFNKNEGDVAITIDGAPVKTISCQTPELIPQKAAYRQIWTEAGSHVIKIEKKSGTFMLLDAFQVYNRPPR